METANADKQESGQDRDVTVPVSTADTASARVPSPQTGRKSRGDSETRQESARSRTTQGDKVCVVCGDRARANNFGALTCDTCKAFFRRNALQQEELRCVFQDQCVIVKATRRICTACRLKKCFAVGMKPQLIQDERVKKARMARRQEKQLEREKSQAAAEGKDINLYQPSSPPASGAGESHLSQTVPASSSSQTANTTPPALFSSSSQRVSLGQLSSLPQADSPSPRSSPPTRQTIDSCLSSPAYVSQTINTTSFIDTFFQQALEGSNSASSEFNTGYPTATQNQATCSDSSQRSDSFTCSNIHQIQSTDNHARDSPGNAQTAEDCDWNKNGQSLIRGRIKFYHVSREELPSNMKQFWLLSEDERMQLTRLSATYQDTMMTLAEREPGKPFRQTPQDMPVSMDDYMSMLEKVLHLCVRFAKNVPEFQQLPQADQIATLKAASLSCYGVALSAFYIPEQETWLTLLGQMRRDHIPPGVYSKELLTGGTDFCYNLKMIAKNDITQYALLHCIVLFDPRESFIEDRQLINRLNDKYIILLKHYLESEYSFLHADRYFTALLDLVSQIRMLGKQSRSLYTRLADLFKPLTAELLSTE